MMDQTRPLQGSSARGALIATALGTVLIVASSLSSGAEAKSAQEPRKLASFSKVTANGSSDVMIKVGPKQSVVVHAEDDELDQIRTEVRNGELKIWRKSGRRGFGNHSAYVVISVPALTRLESNGSGDASVENMKAKEFRLIQQGSGDVAIDGSCDEIDITSQGSGDLESSRLICGKIDVNLRGSGDMELDHVKAARIDLDAVGSGDVSMKGSCENFDLRHMASGDVDARHLECGNVSVNAAGSGDMRVYASKTVTIKVHGSGDVEVYGGAHADDLSAAGSGHVRIHKN